MLDKPQKFGRQGELDAARYLQKNGYKILTRNYRTQVGEVDIVARERDTIVFVEVKARRSGFYGHPKSAVTPQKQRRISMAALHYLKAMQLSEAKARFDVVAIRLTGGKPEFEIVKNAFELAYD